MGRRHVPSNLGFTVSEGFIDSRGPLLRLASTAVWIIRIIVPVAAKFIPVGESGAIFHSDSTAIAARDNVLRSRRSSRGVRAGSTRVTAVGCRVGVLRGALWFDDGKVDGDDDRGSDEGEGDYRPNDDYIPTRLGPWWRVDVVLLVKGA